LKDADNISGRGAVPESLGSTSTGLLQEARAGDPGAWGRLARLYGPLVYQWGRRRGLPAPDAEDVVQEVFLTVAGKLAQFRRGRPGGTFRGWLWAITRNKVGDWLRRQAAGARAVGGTDAQRRLLEAALPEGDDGPPPDTAGLYQRALDLIRAEFDERGWEVFRRLVMEEQGPADVAAAVGLSRSAVYVIKSRVLRRLREVLGDR
jgi:RNA polymerase sigma-70 factor (ECF subfamily)